MFRNTENRFYKNINLYLVRQNDSVQIGKYDTLEKVHLLEASTSDDPDYSIQLPVTCFQKPAKAGIITSDCSVSMILSDGPLMDGTNSSLPFTLRWFSNGF